MLNVAKAERCKGECDKAKRDSMNAPASAANLSTTADVRRNLECYPANGRVGHRNDRASHRTSPSPWASGPCGTFAQLVVDHCPAAMARAPGVGAPECPFVAPRADAAGGRHRGRERAVCGRLHRNRA